MLSVSDEADRHPALCRVTLSKNLINGMVKYGQRGAISVVHVVPLNRLLVSALCWLQSVMKSDFSNVLPALQFCSHVFGLLRLITDEFYLKNLESNLENSEMLPNDITSLAVHRMLVTEQTATDMWQTADNLVEICSNIANGVLSDADLVNHTVTTLTAVLTDTLTTLGSFLQLLTNIQRTFSWCGSPKGPLLQESDLLCARHVIELLSPICRVAKPSTASPFTANLPIALTVADALLHWHQPVQGPLLGTSPSLDSAYIDVLQFLSAFLHPQNQFKLKGNLWPLVANKIYQFLLYFAVCHSEVLIRLGLHGSTQALLAGFVHLLSSQPLPVGTPVTLHGLKAKRFNYAKGTLRSWDPQKARYSVSVADESFSVRPNNLIIFDTVHVDVPLTIGAAKADASELHGMYTNYLQAKNEQCDFEDVIAEAIHSMANLSVYIVNSPDVRRFVYSTGMLPTLCNLLFQQTRLIPPGCIDLSETQASILNHTVRALSAMIYWKTDSEHKLVADELGKVDCCAVTAACRRLLYDVSNKSEVSAQVTLMRHLPLLLRQLCSFNQLLFPISFPAVLSVLTGFDARSFSDIATLHNAFAMGIVFMKECIETLLYRGAVCFDAAAEGRELTPHKHSKIDSKTMRTLHMLSSVMQQNWDSKGPVIAQAHRQLCNLFNCALQDPIGFSQRVELRERVMTPEKPYNSFCDRFPRPEEPVVTLPLSQLHSPDDSNFGYPVVTTAQDDSNSDEITSLDMGPVCTYCGISQAAPATQLKVCERCRTSWYCGRQCQRSDHSHHRSVCQRYRNEKENT